MTISTIRIGRCYPWIRRLLGCGPHRFQEQDPQCCEGRQRRSWLRCQRILTAGSRVQHPDRDLLNTSNSSVNEAAARNRTGRPLDHLMNANSALSPGMPQIGNGHLIDGHTTVGLVA
jgi:hypothetical protein